MNSLVAKDCQRRESTSWWAHRLLVALTIEEEGVEGDQPQNGEGTKPVEGGKVLVWARGESFPVPGEGEGVSHRSPRA